MLKIRVRSYTVTHILYIGTLFQLMFMLLEAPGCVEQN